MFGVYGSAEAEADEAQEFHWRCCVSAVMFEVAQAAACGFVKDLLMFVRKEFHWSGLQRKFSEIRSSSIWVNPLRRKILFDTGFDLRIVA